MYRPIHRQYPNYKDGHRQKLRSQPNRQTTQITTPIPRAGRDSSSSRRRDPRLPNGSKRFPWSPEALLALNPLYLNIDRPLNSSEPIMDLCRRSNSVTVENIGIPQFLRNLIASLQGQPRSPLVRSSFPRPRYANSEAMSYVPAAVWTKSNPKDPSQTATRTRVLLCLRIYLWHWSLLSKGPWLRSVPCVEMRRSRA